MLSSKIPGSGKNCLVSVNSSQIVSIVFSGRLYVDASSFKVVE